jgi:phospholipase/carboxylesterase
MAETRLIIFLHGIGASGAQLQPLTTAWQAGLPGAVFATPNAPFSNGHGGHLWFKVDGLQLDPGRIRDAREAFDLMMHTVVTRAGFSDRLDLVAFVGVSQGAIVALDAVASGRWKIGALVAFSGLLPVVPPHSDGPQAPVLLVHGKDDRTIPPVASETAAGQLRSAGFPVDLIIEPRVGHTISTTGAAKALDFLQRTLDQ